MIFSADVLSQVIVGHLTIVDNLRENRHVTPKLRGRTKYLHKL